MRGLLRLNCNRKPGRPFVCELVHERPRLILWNASLRERIVGDFRCLSNLVASRKSIRRCRRDPDHNFTRVHWSDRSHSRLHQLLSHPGLVKHQPKSDRDVEYALDGTGLFTR